MTDAKALATGLWVLMTYLPNSIDTMPLLSICSPQKRCGKSTLLQLLTQLCYRPLPSSNISMAGIYRGIDLMHPTLLIDECDQWLRREKDAIGVLNSGHNRAMAHILRADGNTLRNFSTWSPKALAGIGMLSTHADTLSDRSIIVTLDRRRKNQTITPLRSAPAGQFERMLDRSLPGPNRMPKI
jgi:putative DNA primase/helicase